MKDTITIQVCPEGDLIMIYQDPVKIFLDLGSTVIKRASHVEPGGARGTSWTADMSPVGGPILGPLDTRQEALIAEVEWLENSMADRATSMVLGSVN